MLTLIEFILITIAASFVIILSISFASTYVDNITNNRAIHFILTIIFSIFVLPIYIPATIGIMLAEYITKRNDDWMKDLKSDNSKQYKQYKQK